MYLIFLIFRSFNLEFLWTYYQIRIIFKWKNRRNYKETIISIGLRVKLLWNETRTKRIVWGGGIFPNGSENSRILPKIPEYFRKFPNTSGKFPNNFRKFPSGSKHSRIFPSLCSLHSNRPFRYSLRNLCMTSSVLLVPPCTNGDDNSPQTTERDRLYLNNVIRWCVQWLITQCFHNIFEAWHIL